MEELGEGVIDLLVLFQLFGCAMVLVLITLNCCIDLNTVWMRLDSS